MKKDFNTLKTNISGNETASVPLDGHLKGSPLRILLLAYMAISFVLVLISIGVHTLTQGGGLWMSYLFIPAALGFAVLMAAGGILFFRQMTERSGKEGAVSKTAVGISAIIAVVLVFFGVYIFWTGIVNPLRDIPYLSEPAVIRLDQVSFECDNWSDSTTITLSGVTDQGRKMDFAIDEGTYDQGMTLEKGENPGNIQAQVSYLPNSGNVMSVEMWVEE